MLWSLSANLLGTAVQIFCEINRCLDRQRTAVSAKSGGCFCYENNLSCAASADSGFGAADPLQIGMMADGPLQGVGTMSVAVSCMGVIGQSDCLVCEKLGFFAESRE